MGSRIRIFLIVHQILTTIVAQEFQITVYEEPNFKGMSSVLSGTGCFYLEYRTDYIASVKASNACAILYKDYSDDGECSLEQFAIIPQNDPVALDLTGLNLNLITTSFSRCNYCPRKILPTVQAYSFFVSDYKTVAGHHFNTAEFNPLNRTNICGQILDELSIPFFIVSIGCVQFYSTTDCTTAEPEINKFQIIHGVREWNAQKPVKSFSHCFLHCEPESERNYVGVRGRYVEEQEPATSGIRVTHSSGLRENIYAKHMDEDDCEEAPGIKESNISRILAKDICIVLYPNVNCNTNMAVLKPTVLEAKGGKIADINVPNIFHELPRVQSYMLCTALTRFEAYHLVLEKTRFFKDNATTSTISIFKGRNFDGVGQILNISECTVLPHRLTVTSSIDSHGKCILLFDENNCTGHYEKLEIGSPVLRNMRLLRFRQSYQSIQLCSNNAELTTEVDLHYNFTHSQIGYNWTFSSHANQSSMCWELPYYYRIYTAHQRALVVNSGCLKLFAGLQCNPFSQHFTVTSSSNAKDLKEWSLEEHVDLGSFTSCADLGKYPRTQSPFSRQRISFPYNYPNGTFYLMRSGEVQQNLRGHSCALIPRYFRNETASDRADEISSVFVNNDCIFVFDQQDCTMSENTTLPIMLNATDGPLEINLTESPFWKKPFSVVSTIDCHRFISGHNFLKMIYMTEHERQSPKNSTESSTTSQAIYMSPSAALIIGLGIVILAIVLGIAIYFKARSTQKNQLLDVFYNGSDEPSTSNEDAIQSMAIDKTLEIPSANFTYVQSGDGSLVVLGSGCFGKVVRGILHTGFDELTNCQLTKNVAIKTPKIGITLEQIRSLLCEIKICAFVEKHKNIVEFIGFCIEDIDLGKVSILLDFCENGSLLQFLRDHVKDFQNNCKIEHVEQISTELRVGCSENNFSNNETLDYSRLLTWCQEIAEGMEYLSSKNVLHADLAARNCLLDSDLQIKITDFGLSRKLYDYGIYVKKSKAKLPWPWMALEALKSFTFSVKTDVWSYGVCLWEIFSFGDRPYPTLTWNEDFIENLSAGLRLSKPKLCPEYCYQLMLNCWHEDPNERNDFMELRKAMSKFRQGKFCNTVVEDDHSGLSASNGSSSKKTKISLGGKLYAQLQTGTLLDLILTVESTKLHAHKTVVTVASTIIKDKLSEQLSSGVGERKGVIDLPNGTTVEAAKCFIKVMYLEEIDTELDVKLLLQVMSLCDEYLVKDLLEHCVSSMVGVIDAENCLVICEASAKMKNCKSLLDAAFLCVISNIEKILDESATSISYKMWKKILTHEGPDAVNIAEETLFKQLLKWRNEDAAMKPNQFKSLLQLIRFPLMNAATIAQIVQPAKVLSEFDLNDLFCYIIGSGDNGDRIPKFTSHSRKAMVAKNGSELASMLKTAKAGDFIQLIAAEYVVCLTVPSKVTLKGVGPDTVIIPLPPSPTNTRRQKEAEHDNELLNIDKGHDVKISNLKFMNPTPCAAGAEQQLFETDGSRNILTNLDFENCLVYITGKFNHVSNINCHTGDSNKLMSVEYGGNNSISNVSLKNSECGINIDGGSCGNVVKSVKCVNVQYGMWITTNDNLVQDVNYSFNLSEDKAQYAVGIFGSQNNVTKVKCEGFELMEGEKWNKFSLFVNTLENSQEPTNNVVTNCGPGPVQIKGRNNSLWDVNAADLILLGGESHTLSNCSARECINESSADVELVDCNFTL